MWTLLNKFYTFRHIHANISYIKILRKNYIKDHPYKNIHPWKSLSEFSNDLINNLIYNKGNNIEIYVFILIVYITCNNILLYNNNYSYMQ